MQKIGSLSMKKLFNYPRNGLTKDRTSDFLQRCLCKNQDRMCYQLRHRTMLSQGWRFEDYTLQRGWQETPGNKKWIAREKGSMQDRTPNLSIIKHRGDINTECVYRYTIEPLQVEIGSEEKLGQKRFTESELLAKEVGSKEPTEVAFSKRTGWENRERKLHRGIKRGRKEEKSAEWYSGHIIPPALRSTTQIYFGEDEHLSIARITPPSGSLKHRSPHHTASLCVCKVAVVFTAGLCFEQNSLAPFASFVVDLSVVNPRHVGNLASVKTGWVLPDVVVLYTEVAPGGQWNTAGGTVGVSEHPCGETWGIAGDPRSRDGDL
ncbi:hypothetical protein FB451DRAFT_1192361 [Mycena latifolia]|nr:hypothetical protein FB451DRAFT_1192361 [Mycena latifolia]